VGEGRHAHPHRVGPTAQERLEVAGGVGADLGGQGGAAVGVGVGAGVGVGVGEGVGASVGSGVSVGTAEGEADGGADWDSIADADGPRVDVAAAGSPLGPLTPNAIPTRSARTTPTPPAAA
jgi:hypothetical protein